MLNQKAFVLETKQPKLIIGNGKCTYNMGLQEQYHYNNDYLGHCCSSIWIERNIPELKSDNFDAKTLYFKKKDSITYYDTKGSN